MKREHKIQKSNLVSFLETHNCLLYSPLSQYDTTDWISGNTITPADSGNMIWDSTNNIWKFTKINSSPGYYAKCTLNETIQRQTLYITCCAEFRPYNKDGANANVWDFLPTMLGVSLYGNINQTGQSAQAYGVENNKSYQFTTLNGQAVGNKYVYNTILNQPYTTDVMFGWVNRNYTFGLRNVGIFHQAFSLQEINEYFSLI